MIDGSAPSSLQVTSSGVVSSSSFDPALLARFFRVLVIPHACGFSPSSWSETRLSVSWSKRSALRKGASPRIWDVCAGVGS